MTLDIKTVGGYLIPKIMILELGYILEKKGEAKFTN